MYKYVVPQKPVFKLQLFGPTIDIWLIVFANNNETSLISALLKTSWQFDILNELPINLKHFFSNLFFTDSVLSSLYTLNKESLTIYISRPDHKGTMKF